MAVVFVQRIHHTGCDFMHLTGRQIFNRSIARDAIDGFKVVLIFECVFGIRTNRRDVEAEPHIVISQQQANTLPLFSGNPAFCFLGIL